MWRRGVLVGRVRVLVRMLSGPDPAWAARGLDEHYVDVLMNSFITSGTINQDFLGVVVDDGTFDRCHPGQLVAVGGVMACIVRDIGQLLVLMHVELDELGKSGPLIRMVQGNHSRVALVKLGDLHPSNELFTFIDFEVLVCRSGPETDRFLTVLGNLDNVKARLAPSFESTVCGTHYRLFSSGSLLTDARVAQEKADLEYSMELSATSASQIMQLAVLKGRIWDLAEKSLKGKFTKNMVTKINNKTPQSGAHFSKFPHLPDAMIEALLGSVLSNDMTWVMMQIEIQKFKMSIRIKTEINATLSLRGKCMKMAEGDRNDTKV